MRILQVIHQFPPYSSQGSEVYCYNLSHSLARTDDVRIFHVANVKRRWPRRLSLENHHGLPIYHCIDGAEYSRLAAWPNSFLRSQFQSVLDKFAPQIVHFHNFLSLGDDLVSTARSSGARVVYTLHDFGLICPNALLLRSDRTLCSKDDGNFFQDCCPRLIRTSSQNWFKVPWRAWVPSRARWRLYGEQHPQPVLRALLLAGVNSVGRWMGDPDNDLSLKRDFFLSHTRRIFRDADLFLAPSRFLLQRYVACGLAANKIVYSRYGMRRDPLVSCEKTARQRPVRFGYIGALHPHKGIELLLDAFQGIADRAELWVYGSPFGSPISQSYLRRIQNGNLKSISFRGSYDNEHISSVLSQLDIIVVPSLWYENSPLTIQEAFIGGVPVITADKGGMAELVRDGVNGLQFRLGDAADLRAKMLHVVNHPEVMDRLRRGIPDTVDIEVHTTDLRGRYEELLRKRPETAQRVGAVV